MWLLEGILALIYLLGYIIIACFKAWPVWTIIIGLVVLCMWNGISQGYDDGWIGEHKRKKKR